MYVGGMAAVGTFGTLGICISATGIGLAAIVVVAAIGTIVKSQNWSR